MMVDFCVEMAKNKGLPLQEKPKEKCDQMQFDGLCVYDGGYRELVVLCLEVKRTYQEHSVLQLCRQLWFIGKMFNAAGIKCTLLGEIHAFDFGTFNRTYINEKLQTVTLGDITFSIVAKELPIDEYYPVKKQKSFLFAN